MHKLSKLTVTAALAFVLSLAAVPVITYAESDSDSPTTMTTPVESEPGETEDQAGRTPEAAKQAAEKMREAAKQQAEKAREAAKQRQEDKGKSGTGSKKLEATKLKVCQKRETKINSLMVRIGERGQKQVKLIDAIAQRAEAFKNGKNLTVAEYDTLQSAVTASKAAAETAVEATKAVQVSFKCDGSDPTGAASSFLETMKVQNDAIKTYRNSVIDMLKAIKKSQAKSGTSTSDAGSATEGGN